MSAGAPGALAGRVVLVSGAHGGLGRAASLACARAGATLVLLGHRVPKLNRTYDAIVGAGLPEPVNCPIDLAGATPEDFADLAARIGTQLGRLDGILHCAAEFAGPTPLEHTDPRAFARVLQVGLTARTWLTLACLPLLRAAPAAQVVFAIDGDADGRAYRGGYGLAQAGQRSLVAMFAAEVAGSRIGVHAFDPGPMRTALRARAWVEAEDRIARDPAVAADACVALLAGAGVAELAAAIPVDAVTGSAA